jgi:hypothetical protein
MCGEVYRKQMSTSIIHMTIKNGIWEIFGGKTDDDIKYEKSMRLYTT